MAAEEGSHGTRALQQARPVADATVQKLSGGTRRERHRWRRRRAIRSRRHVSGGRVAITMVAQEAGVSVPTVSKVLNGRQEVGADTRRRVQDVLKATGYRRRPRSDGAGRTGLIDFVITELDTSWGVELLRGAEQEASGLGARLVLTLSHDRQARPRDWVKTISSRPTDGVVLVVTNP